MKLIPTPEQWGMEDAAGPGGTVGVTICYRGNARVTLFHPNFPVDAIKREFDACDARSPLVLDAFVRGLLLGSRNEQLLP